MQQKHNVERCIGQGDVRCGHHVRGLGGRTAGACRVAQGHRPPSSKGSRARWQSRLSHELLTWSSTYVAVPYLPCTLVLKHNFKPTHIRTNYSLLAVDRLVFTSSDVSLLVYQTHCSLVVIPRMDVTLIVTLLRMRMWTKRKR